MAGRNQEILLVIDELADMLAQQTSRGQSLLAAELEELAVRHARNYGVNLAIAIQSLSSVEPGIQNVLMQMGTQIVGRIANPDDALTIAKQLLVFDPMRIKKVENVWFGMQEAIGYGQHVTKPTIIDQRTVEYTSDEQFLILADHLKQLQRFEFMLRTATAEGNISHKVREVSIANDDRDQYPDEAYLAYVRSYLRYEKGVPVQELLDEIAQRRAPTQLERKPKKKTENTSEKKALPIDGTIGDAHDGDAHHSVPRRTTTTGTTPATPENRTPPPADDEDDYFR
jgi:hypothetical protein